jgi:hypothetical protein
MGRRSRLDVQQPAGIQRLGFASDGEGFERLELDRITRKPARLLGDHDLAGGGTPFKALGNVDGVPGDEPVAPAGVARDHLAAGHAHPCLELHPVVGLELLVQLGEALPHLGCCPNGAEGVVLVQVRNPKDGHDRVADELLDGATVVLQDLAHLVEVALEHAPHQFGIDLLAQRGGAADVGKDDGDQLPELASLRHVGNKRRAAFGTELRVLRVLAPAGKTCLHRGSLGPELPQLLARLEMPKVCPFFIQVARQGAVCLSVGKARLRRPTAKVQERRVPKVGVEPTRGVSPTGF